MLDWFWGESLGVKLTIAAIAGVLIYSYFASKPKPGQSKSKSNNNSQGQ